MAVERVTCPVADDFTISRGTTETATTVVVRISDGEHTGVGGVAPTTYYGETPDSVEEALPDLLAAVEEADPHGQQAIARRLADRAPEAAAARAAVSGAVHDLAGKRAGEPVYRRWGLSPDAAPPTSYTVGIADPDEMADRAAGASAAGFEVLKVKVGTDDDRARVRAVREAAPDARLRVDANEAWAPERAVEMAAWLADQGVEFLEQPCPTVAGLGQVREAGHLPVAADESCVTAADVPAVADAVDIVVTKLGKCGGLRPAARQVATANAHGLKTMVGCMVASDAAIAPACHLAPLCDYADLDGALLLDEDPYEGVPVEDRWMDLRAVAAGTGVRSVE